MKTLKEVTNYCESLRPIFFLQGWGITYQLARDDRENVMAEMTSKNQYREAILTIFPKFFTQNSAYQKSQLVHEMCHIITSIQNGLVQVARDGQIIPQHEVSYAFEEETTWMANIIDTLINK